MKFENILIPGNHTIIDALKKLNEIREYSRLILFVIQEDGSVLGSLTDGDIRRSLAKDADVNKKVSEVCNTSFIFEYDRPGYFDLRNYRKTDIKILPVLDENKRIVRILDLEKTKSVLPMECMIMAGGRGKRLSPMTDTIPKPMLTLGGKPIIEHNIDRLISFGIKKIFISVKYLGEQIQDYFGDGSKKGISIEYVWEQKPLGTAGALSLVEDFTSSHILLMNSDLFTNVDFEDLYNEVLESDADMGIASTEYKIDVPYAVFKTEDNKVVEFKEKPSYVYHSNAGIYILKKELIQKIPKQEFYDITDLMQNLVENKGNIVHKPIIGFWIDIGKPVDYEQAQELVKHSK
ncbi:MAG: nucleotidyltransferase family protein [Christiangramia sp.]|nr:nucleotidyltransferase family protein [Christiangramia sp.]